MCCDLFVSYCSQRQHKTPLICLIFQVRIPSCRGSRAVEAPTPTDPEDVKEMIAAQDLHTEFQFPP